MTLGCLDTEALKESAMVSCVCLRWESHVARLRVAEGDCELLTLLHPCLVLCGAGDRIQGLCMLGKYTTN